MLLPPNNIAFTECPSPPLSGVASPPLIPLGGRLVRGYLLECIGVKYRKINIYSQLSDYNSQIIILWAQFKFSVASPRGANQKMVQHDTG